MQSTTSDFSSNQWVHLMLSIDKSNSNITFYQNGTAIGVHTDQTIDFDPSIANQELILGSSVLTGSNYKGYIDDFTLFDSALSDMSANQVFDSYQYDTSKTLPLNQWSHVAANYDKVRKETNVFVNGQNIGKYVNYDAVINNNTSNIVF